MDPHVRWLRRRIAAAITRIALIWFLAATVAAFAVLALATAGIPIVHTPWALLIGQLTVLVGLGRAAFGNPLSVMYLRNEAEQPRRYVVSSEEVGDDVVKKFASHQLSPLAVLAEPDADEATFDLFQTRRRTVTMARNRQSGSVSFCSRLSDDRILLTDSFLTVPHQRLVLNRSDLDDVNSLIDAHAGALRALADHGITSVADDGGVFIEALDVEHEALLGVGAVLGPFLNLGLERAPLRFLVSIDVDEMPSGGLPSTPIKPDLVAP